MEGSPYKELKFVQVNLHHAKAATYNLMERAKEQHISVACAQEMHQVRSRTVGIPAMYKSYTSLRDTLKAGIIIFQQDISVMKMCATKNAVAVIISYRNLNLLVVSVYCPPSEDLSDSLQDIESCLQHPYDRVIIAGDFNSKSPVWGSDVEDERGRELLEFVLSKGLTVVNEENIITTFEGSRGKSWVDITISDPHIYEHIFKWRVDLEPTASDHNSISFSLYTGKSKKSCRFHLNNINTLKFRNLISKELSSRELSHSEDIDLAVDGLIHTITAACQKSVLPQTTVSRKQKWWDKSLEILRSHVRREKRKLYQSKHPEDRRYLRARFKQIESEYKYKLNAAKRDGWTGTCEEVTADQPFGVHFDTAKTPDRRNFQLTVVRKPEGTLTATTEEALQELLSFNFPIDSQQDSSSHASIRRTSRIPPRTDDDPLFTVQESNRDDTSPSAFRPICLLDALGKVLDRLLPQRLFHHLLKTGRIGQQQFGFVPGRSAPEAIIQLKNWISVAREQETHSAIISLDVQSTFSRVWWPLVLHNLKKMDCPRNLFGLTASFLTNRTFSLLYGDKKLSRSYTIGCPQGSNSGPLLWLLVMNDALEIDFPTDVKMLAYADDLYLFVAATGKQTIKSRATEALELLNAWSKKARVQFAHEKTQLIPFGKKGRHRHPPYCSFAGKPIKLTRQLKILGVILDDRLNGKAYLSYIGDKVSKILNRLTIAKFNRGLSGKVLKALYKALERILVYAAPAWWTGTVKQAEKINSIQRPVLLAITGAFRTTSTAALQVISGVEPADLVCEFETSIFKLKYAIPNVHGNRSHGPQH
ncbi:Putative protein in type-1 retrotransposable element R1DM [Araneus ventricosus]|uniref:Reverse transcriptase domain-containing protein n=1 Tax=Araneus ventricosus TaxID=182803 RepID=A0A4Y2HF30_ARAVE|nr:Putative protein in type-1 retrotransposable element R1DM [Araneus ventricosus]